MVFSSALTRILVVDDDDTIRETVAEALELDGFAVETARNGAEALAVVREQRPRGIILDLMMPDMSDGNSWSDVGPFNCVKGSRSS